MKHIVSICLLILLAFRPASAQVSYDEIKAPLIMQLTRDISWPFEKDLMVFRIGVIGNDTVTLNNLRGMADTERIKGKKIEIISLRKLNEEVQKLQVIYADKTYSENLADIASLIENRQILLITEQSADKKYIMLNITLNREAGEVSFEINKANIILAGLQIEPELLLLGGTEIDVRELYREMREMLEQEKITVEEQRMTIQEQLDKIDLYSTRLYLLSLFVDSLNMRIGEQTQMLNALTDSVKHQQQLASLQNTQFQEQKSELTEQQKIIADQVRSIRLQNRKLDEQNRIIAINQNTIEEQEETLGMKDVLLETRERLLYNIIALGVAVLALAVTIFIAYSIKQRANRLLGQKVEERTRELTKEIHERKKTAQALKESEEKFKALFVSSGDAALVVEHSTIIDCNDRALTLLDGKREDLIGLNPWDFSPAKQPGGEDSKDESIKMIDQVFRLGSLQFEWTHKKFTGEIFEAEVSMGVVDRDRKIFIATLRDITDRKKSQQQLKESEEKFRNIFNSSSEGIVVTDPQHRIMAVNNKFSVLAGLSSVPLKVPLDNYIEQNSRINLNEPRDQLIAGKEVAPVEVILSSGNGKLVPVEVNAKIIDYENQPAVLYIMRDIGERKELQRKLFHARVESEEKERERYARELHDGLGPILSTCKIFFHTLQHVKEEDRRKEQVRRAGELLEEALRSIREISNNLSPHILRNYGLTQALESFTEKLSGVTRIKFEISSNLNDRMPETEEFTLYRTLVELINNSVKYSQANRISVNINSNDRIVDIHYQDNGKGFDYSTVKKQQKGFGLLNLETRIREIGGTYYYKTAPDKGVEVDITISTDFV